MFNGFVNICNDFHADFIVKIFFCPIFIRCRDCKGKNFANSFVTPDFNAAIFELFAY